MIKKFSYLLILLVILTGCFEDEKPKKKKIKKVQATEYLAKKVDTKKDNNSTIVDTIENDGIVIDGARDEKLLIAFDKAVSQVIMEEGVSVPDCSALANTGYLTAEDCQEITDKYFGFYELDLETGEAKKVDDVFKSGISGQGVDIRDSEVDLFDSSGNPLLENLVEFEELIDNSEDVNMLKKLSAKIPETKKKLKEKVEKRIEFLEDIQELQKVVVNKDVTPVEEEDKDNIQNQQNQDELNSINNVNVGEYEENPRLKLTEAKNKYDKLLIEYQKVQNRLVQNPDSESLIERENELDLQLRQLESEMVYYESLIE